MSFSPAKRKFNNVLNMFNTGNELSRNSIDITRLDGVLDICVVRLVRFTRKGLMLLHQQKEILKKFMMKILKSCENL